MLQYLVRHHDVERSVRVWPGLVLGHGRDALGSRDTRRQTLQSVHRRSGEFWVFCQGGGDVESVDLDAGSGVRSVNPAWRNALRSPLPHPTSRSKSFTPCWVGQLGVRRRQKVLMCETFRCQRDGHAAVLYMRYTAKRT